MFRISQGIENVDSSAFKRGAAGSAISAESNWILGYKILELLRRVESHRHPQQLAIKTVNERSIGPTQPDRAFGNGFKHRLKVERRAANDLQHSGCCGLLLQRFREIGRALA